MSVPSARASARLAVALVAAGLLGLVVPLEGADFPEVTAAERALDSVPAAVPGTRGVAPAVVLFERANLRFSSAGADGMSTLEVIRRLKILTPEGLELAQFQVPHDRRVRLLDLAARTVLPDGRAIAADDDDIFREQVSKASKEWTTKVAMPAVEVGAILDLSFTLGWPGVFYLEPWVFDSRIPTLLSEITYHRPDSLSLQFWGLETTNIPMQREDGKSARGSTVRVWMENLPALPDEPLSFPEADLASRFLAIPTAITRGNSRTPLLADWKTTTALFEPGYRQFRKRASDARAEGKALAAKTGGRRAAAEAIFRFVRDEIETSGGFDVLVGEGSADRLLEERRGSVTEKALLLQAMLQGAAIDSQLAWVANRIDGRVDTSVANPSAFDASLVGVRLDGQEFWLDPSDPGLAFGQLSPLYEGMPTVRWGRSVTLVEQPWSPAADNTRRARVDLSLDAAGRVQGEGSMELLGGPAWSQIDGDDAGLVDSWQASLDELYPGFVVSSLEIVTAPDERSVALSWRLEQREEDILGDEVSLFPARPLAARQPFTLPPAQRLTPVQTLYAGIDEVELSLRFPEGWTVDALPRPVDSSNDAGAFRARCTVDAAERLVQCRRHFERSRAEYLGQQAYTLIQQIYEKAATHDALPLALVAP